MVKVDITLSNNDPLEVSSNEYGRVLVLGLCCLFLPALPVVRDCNVTVSFISNVLVM